MKRMKLTLAIVSGIFLIGCGAPEKGSTLIDDVYAFNDGVRWNHIPKAASHVHPKERDEFIADRAELEDELKISDYDVVNIEYLKKKTRAKVHVKYTWFLDSKGVVHTTTTLQRWRRLGKRWMVMDERRLRGEPMPGVEERDKKGENGKTRKAEPGSAGGAARIDEPPTI